MNKNFVSYFLNFIYHSKTRQRLLIIAVVGLFLSSFSLLVIQSIMGGLQSGLIKRSKNIHGNYIVKFYGNDVQYAEIQNNLIAQKIDFIPEYEIEVVLRNKNYVTPAIIRGVDFNQKVPPFLANKDYSGVILGADLGSKLNIYFDGQISILSPSHLDSMLGTIPNQVTGKVSDFFISELTEVDSFYAWTRLSLIRNLVRKKNANIFRVYSDIPPDSLDFLKKKYLSIVTWEQKNASLVKALRLETTVMFFLFICMSFLVAVSIISGFLIFYSKVRNDMISFWVLGLPQNRLFDLLKSFNVILGVASSFLGIIFGLAFLLILDKTGLEFMPEVFVERKLPVNITLFGLLSSFFIPSSISVLFSYVSLGFFKRENPSMLKHIRSIS